MDLPRLLLPPTLLTPRLELAPLTREGAAPFHALVTDPHIRRYLMDGEIVPFEWASKQVDESVDRFARVGTGTWLASLRSGDPMPLGFCGFVELAGTGLGLELVYGLRKSSTGQGLATEMAAAVLSDARERAGLRFFSASVDLVNVDSVRVLKKLGFRWVETRQGAFGELLIFECVTS